MESYTTGESLFPLAHRFPGDLRLYPTVPVPVPVSGPVTSPSMQLLSLSLHTNKIPLRSELRRSRAMTNPSEERPWSLSNNPYLYESSCVDSIAHHSPCFLRPCHITKDGPNSSLCTKTRPQAKQIQSTHQKVLPSTTPISTAQSLLACSRRADSLTQTHSLNPDILRPSRACRQTACCQTSRSTEWRER